jgi:hypothetical protein
MALLPALISGGIGIGEAVSAPGAPPAPTLPKTPTITPQQIDQAQMAVASSGANTQAATGQGLSPTYNADAINQLINQQYGTPG